MIQFTVDTESWLDVLKYDEPPKFDVLAKSIEFANSNKRGTSAEEFYADDYVFRGPIIGPISFEDVKSTQEGFNIQNAYPNLETRPFGFTIDPDNEYRCYWFERWEGTNTEGVKVGPLDLPPTGNDVKFPTHIMSANWTPDGKIKYLCLSSPMDRFEGTTQGAGAIFGLLVGAGVQCSSASPGDAFLRFSNVCSILLVVLVGLGVKRKTFLVGGRVRHVAQTQMICKSFSTLCSCF